MRMDVGGVAPALLPRWTWGPAPRLAGPGNVLKRTSLRAQSDQSNLILSW